MAGDGPIQSGNSEHPVPPEREHEALARLAAIVESSDDAIAGFTLDGTITSWNPGATRIYGYTADEMIGQPMTLLLPTDRTDELPRILERLRQGERVDHFETTRLRKDRRRIRISLSVSPIRAADGTIIGASGIARDVTVRRWSEELLAAERQVFEMIARGEPFSTVLETLALRVEALADEGLLASILVLDQDGVHLRHGAAPSLPREYNLAIDGLAVGPSVGSCGTAAYRGETVVVTDIEADPLWEDFRELARTHGLRACWSTPIVGSSGQVLGTFALYYPEPRSPSDEHLRLARLVGRTAATVIERQRAESARARLASIVDSSDDAIIGKTTHGVITSWNPGAERLYGYSVSEMVGRRLDAIVPPDRLDEYWSAMARVRRGKHVAPFDTARIHKNGPLVEVSLSLSPVKDDNGAVIGVSAIARGIAERRKLERLQQEFLAMVTHELRNPLASVKGYALLMRRRAQYMAEAIDSIVGQSEVLERLVNDLLDASRIQIGQLDLERHELDLCAVARAAVAQTQIQSSSHVIGFESPDHPLIGYWDKARLSQVFSNLLSNAVKYSPAGSAVRVVVKDLGNEAEVAVSDMGLGISADELPRLFERFYRADPSKQAARSLGLGLYITRGIVESHGGRIVAESAGEGCGSTFRFTLPYS